RLSRKILGAFHQKALNIESYRPKCFIKKRPQNAANYWTKNRHPGITPIRIGLARDRQNKMREARSKITRRVDGITGGPSKRKPDGENRRADKKRPETFIEPGSGNQIIYGRNGQNAQNQDKGTDDFGDDVAGWFADSRGCAEDAANGCFIGRDFP